MKSSVNPGLEELIKAFSYPVSKDEIPKGTDAGTYYVWYMAKGDANHTDSTPACVTVIINPADKSEKNAASGPVKGKTYKAGGQKYLAASNNTVFLKKAKKKKTVTGPATVTINGKKANVIGIKKGAFYKKTVTVNVKSKKLTKKNVKNCFKGSKVKTVKVKVGKKTENKKYVKKYKKIFTKKNSGKKVIVK